MRRRWQAWILVAMASSLGACDDGETAAADAAVEPPTCPEQVPDGWACIPAGSYTRGSPDNEPQRDDDEEAHTVRLSRPFLVKTTEVTQREWLAHIADNPAFARPGGPGQCAGDRCLDRPVEQVNFYETLAWLNAASEADGLSTCYDLSACTGFVGDGCEEAQPDCSGGYRCDQDTLNFDPDCTGYRLPTEAEWEYAARAGEAESRYANLNEIAWYDLNSMLHSHQVGQRAANAFGLSDVLGNVAEWVWDRYDADYGIFRPSRQLNVDPMGAEFSDTRVLRGCGWRTGGRFCRLAARENLQPGLRNNQLGFRPVRTVF